MVFRGFRLVLGAVLGALALWMIGSGVVEIRSLMAESSSADSLLSPLLGIIGGLLILAVYYYFLWAESAVHRGLENVFAIPELLRKITFTLALLCIYRVGFHVPLPGVDQESLKELMGQNTEGGLGQAIQYFSMFTGGSLQKSTLFGLGIMPYISASIIFTLLTTVVPALEKLQKEGPAGVKKIQEYTRYATVGLCLVQAIFLMKMTTGGANSVLYPEYHKSTMIFLIGVVGLTAGTMFLMWLGEQIDEYGIGNGISLLIMAGIVTRIPIAIQQLRDNFTPTLMGSGGEGGMGLMSVLFLMGMFVFVVAGAILITQGQRRIPIQQAKQIRGRKVLGGQRHYMPLRVNQGGVMPIIFASSLMIFPSVVFGWASSRWPGVYTLSMLQDAFKMGSYTYTVVYVALIFFFAYFWTTIQFRPKETADQLRDMGHFIPGLRPGKRTAEYLERVMERITYCGAAFLALIAVLPTIVSEGMKIPPSISMVLGGTGLLIMVSVALDLVQRVEANLVMRNYGGFLGGSTRIKGSR